MANIKVYFCFEATNTQCLHMYLLYSTQVGDLMRTGPYKKPTFSLEHVIPAFPNMGCGVFGSKIVLAGGLVQVGETMVHNYDLITYDMATKLVSHKDFPPMSQSKLRPLVIQLCQNLYVFDTSDHVVSDSFEIYIPKEKLWGSVFSPYFHSRSPYFWKEKFSGNYPYSWFAFGKCICLSTQTDNNAFIHHTDQFVRGFAPRFGEGLPFQGMAITYHQRGFSDVVVISFSYGRVEGRRLIPSRRSLGGPKLLFETEPYQPDGEMSTCFSDCGQGMFCLTTFDNVNIHVYMFKISRGEDLDDGSLDLNLISINVHKFDFTDFSTGGNASFRVLGCLAPSTAGCDKHFEESILYRSYFPLLEWREKENQASFLDPNQRRVTPDQKRFGAEHSRQIDGVSSYVR